MKKEYLQYILLIGGILMWIVSYILDYKLIYPSAIIGFYLAPFLTLIGIIVWFINYKEKNKCFPNPFQSLYEISQNHGGPFAIHAIMLEFLVRHVLQFWTFCFVVWMIALHLISNSFRNTDAFQALTTKLKEDPITIEKTGGIEGFGFLVGGTLTNLGSSQKAELSFSVIGKKNNLKGNVLMENVSSWKIIQLDYR
ncbi:hypothetical protein GXP67_34590 [Rhodocytophaga rosea]|uniref:Uncharacterized protein n=1 Tax=Rhodocytophaga rosea TaxID=2704465 RepID=A0A6C0GTD4_9BACT|nr:hypothetical protein [Rhodocytophaga rosea]QHT71425.1 hypothetical protein GXP67_34590 [Rhodocytophaga rosea]